MDGREPSPLPPEPASASASHQQPTLTMRKVPQPSCVDESPSPSVPSPPRQAPAQPIPQPPPKGPPLGANIDPTQPNTSRSRATSRPPPILHQQGTPIKDAVNNAFDQSSTVQNQLDPELVRQVTEQVIRNLQTANIAPATPTVVAHPQAQSPHQGASQLHSSIMTAIQRSPTQNSTDSVPPRLTPPLPEKDLGKGGGKYESSPRLPPSDDDSIHSKDSMRSATSTQSTDTPRAVQPEEASLGGMRGSNTTASRIRVDSDAENNLTRRSGGASPCDQSQPRRRDSKDTDADIFAQEKPRSRVRPARVPSDVIEPTTLERIWQPFFENGMPTVRLGQFLRGLANHLIDDYEPKGSLVVTPAKMLRFFSETKLLDERYPWDILFGNRMPTVSLSKVYQKLFCQHHLVQGQPHEIPFIPGLTPNGFATFMTVLIEAHPDMEFERLSHAVMHMPVSNADSKTERFPKELSRRLLPKDANVQAEQRIIASLNHEPFLMSQLRGATAMPPPPPASAPPQSQAFIERERKPYYSTPVANTVDDEDPAPHVMPLERERKPYFAKEGSGKMYSEGERERERDRDRDRDRDTRPPTSYKHALGDGIPAPTRRSSKSSQSIPTQSSLNSGSAAEPISVAPSRSHRHSMGQGPPPAMTNGISGSYSKGPSRRGTPPPRNPYARSEPFDVGGVPPSEYASNLTSRNTPNTRERDHFGSNPDEEFLRRKPSRKSTTRSNDRLADSRGGGSNVTDDDLAAGIAPNGRGYPIPPRPPPSTTQIYESVYAAAQAQPGGMPIGSYPRDRFGPDARRQTWYGASNPDAASGGTDGYGSVGTNNIAGGYTYGSSVRD